MKQIFKRAVSLALCACMLISASGCGAKDSNNKKRKNTRKRADGGEKHCEA